MALVEVGEHPEIGSDSGNDFGAGVWVTTNDGSGGQVLVNADEKKIFETLKRLNEVADINNLTQILT
jgi:hypothetical protein